MPKLLCPLLKHTRKVDVYPNGSCEYVEHFESCEEKRCAVYDYKHERCSILSLSLNKEEEKSA